MIEALDLREKLIARLAIWEGIGALVRFWPCKSGMSRPSRFLSGAESIKVTLILRRRSDPSGKRL